MTLKGASRFGLLAATALCGIVPVHAAEAADPSISGIEGQIRSLEAQLARVRHDELARRADTQHAQEEAEEARREAQEANQRAIQLSGSHSFTGSATGGLYSAGSAYPGTFSQQQLPQNGLGPHGGNTVGEQQASALGPNGSFRIGNVTVTLGGFVAAEAVERQRNETSDIGSTFSGVPYQQSPAYHEPEFRGSARQSRLSLLIQGQPSTAVRVAGYFETDFLSAGVTSNSNESNSYTLRVRQVYATYDNTNLNFHFLGGQAWSLVTLNRVGITPRQENVPLTIDAQYVVGFNWARQWQLRFVEDFFDHRLWAGLSFEEPQTIYSTTTQSTGNPGGVIGGTDNTSNAGGSLLNSGAQYSDDVAPDVVAKLAADPSFGHYELYGLGRFMNARETLSAPYINSGNNRTVLAGGVGAGMLLPIVGKKLVFQASGLVGQGIGRYASGSLPDATINQNGTPIPIPEATLLVGLVAHPTKAVDLYAYAGTEQQEKRSFDDRIGTSRVAFGYGNGGFIDTGCSTEGSSAGCSGQTRGLVDGTAGAWWRFLKGSYGTMEVGTEYEYIRRTAFQGTSVATVGKTVVDSNVTPKTDDNMVLFSFRYLPFQ